MRWGTVFHGSHRLGKERGALKVRDGRNEDLWSASKSQRSNVCDEAGVRINGEPIALTGRFINIFSLELHRFLSLRILKGFSCYCRAHRAGDWSIMSRFALDIEGDTIRCFRLDLKVGYSNGLALRMYGPGEVY